VKQRFRLASSTDFERVRQTGKSFSHPLVVLVRVENQLNQIRVGVAAGKGIGNAVVRNRAKRLIRASVDQFLPDLTPGWDVILIARRPLPRAGFWKTRAALEQVLRKAGLLCSENTPDERRISE
jgi:ribonuclease P protein component